MLAARQRFFFIIVLTCCLFFSFLPPIRCNAQLPNVHLTVLAEEFPPYNYTREGKIVGLSAELVIRLLEESGLKYCHKVYPWKRALETALTTPNTLLYNIHITESRSKHLEWIGPYATHSMQMYKRKHTSASLTKLSDLHNHTTASPRGYVSTDALLALGLREDKNLYSTTTYGAAFKMLMYNRADFVPANPTVLSHYAHMYKIPITDFEKQLPLIAPKGLNIGINNQTDSAIIKHLQKTFERLKQSGGFDDIFAKYNFSWN